MSRSISSSDSNSTSTYPIEIGTPSINYNTPAPNVPEEIDFMPNWRKEEECFKGNKGPNGKEYHREKPSEQIRYENFIAKIIDMNTGKPWTSNEGLGSTPKGNIFPKREITTIIRVRRYDNKEYLLSCGSITGYNSFGDPVTTPCDNPERYNKTLFGYEQQLNIKKRALERINTGPIRSEVVFTLPFDKKNALELYKLRKNDHRITFAVWQEGGLKYQVRKQKTTEDTLKLFTEKEFEYLYSANYLSIDEKERIRIDAENQGLVPKLTNEERTAGIIAQKALSQKDKTMPFQ